MRRYGFSVEVIATGDEIMFGRIVDTNSSWIARRASELGAGLRRVTCVGDDIDEIGDALRGALSRGSDMVIFTGGLGPSEDDLTVEAIGRALGRRVVLDPVTVEKIRRIYAERGVSDTARRERMARVLEGSTATSNIVGMSTGMVLREGRTTIVTFPGIPAEMQAMFEEHVAPVIEGRSGSRHVAKTVTARVVFKDFFPVYHQMQRDYPDAYLKNAATPPESPEERSMVKDIKVDIVVGASTREEGENRMHLLLEDFRGRIEAVGGELLAD
ncbi:MAG: competence/damage-inducible protein A [Candidatus Bathyarchaeota archaeon]|nr:competence/damage-inducible protein A [Candidatus Bathyarchaeota archaeon]